jgi:hypothetical protein
MAAPGNINIPEVARWIFEYWNEWQRSHHPAQFNDFPRGHGIMYCEQYMIPWYIASCVLHHIHAYIVQVSC